MNSNVVDLVQVDFVEIRRLCSLVKFVRPVDSALNLEIFNVNSVQRELLILRPANQPAVRMVSVITRTLELKNRFLAILEDSLNRENHQFAQIANPVHFHFFLLLLLV